MNGRDDDGDRMAIQKCSFAKFILINYIGEENKTGSRSEMKIDNIK
jgi:hypothetical protein